jgi:hypothetical protein
MFKQLGHIKVLLLHAVHVRRESDSFQRRAMNFGVPKPLKANNDAKTM